MVSITGNSSIGQSVNFGTVSANKIALEANTGTAVTVTPPGSMENNAAYYLYLLKQSIPVLLTWINADACISKDSMQKLRNVIHSN